MKQVFIKSGNVTVEEVSAPSISENEILVEVSYSCISAGTEVSSIQMSSLPLYKRALKQPENLKKVFDHFKEHGLQRTYQKVSGKLNAGSPTGYSISGKVVAVGENVHYFSPGDSVACAGAGLANHAEYVAIPVNLAVKVPEKLNLISASTVTLGSIALQGVRRFNPTIGETIVVIGMGLLGQITAQILKANGCKVVGIDVNNNRLEIAKSKGVDFVINNSSENSEKIVSNLTDGFGTDGVIITASSSSSDIIDQSMVLCRKKGRVVLVGDVGLNLKRSLFYSKEIDFFISCSYGPGRYDPVYELEGNDYPLPYVRWTENRNMEAYLDLLAHKKINLEGLYDSPYEIKEATKAYEKIKESTSPLITFLSYGKKDTCSNEQQTFKLKEIKEGQIGVGFIGGGGFTQSVLLPLFRKEKKFSIKHIVTKIGSNARTLGLQYETDHSTSIQDIFNNPNINLVVISTRHNLHGKQVLESLKSGKNVFVEKPLCLTREEFHNINEFLKEKEDVPLLMVGFNRRFSPLIQKIKERLKKNSTPIMINYQMNAGFISPDHWVQNHEGGGRNLGEACHIYDLFNYLTGSEFSSIEVHSISPNKKNYLKNDNFTVSLKYKNGSVCNLIYTSIGSKEFPKETMVIFSDGQVIEMKDYKSLVFYGEKSGKIELKTPKKGHQEEINALSTSISKGLKWPISWNEISQATEIAFQVEEKIFE